ncbi:hypothetical protein D3C73_1081240 [compost metagenome]
MADQQYCFFAQIAHDVLLFLHLCILRLPCSPQSTLCTALRFKISIKPLILFPVTAILLYNSCNRSNSLILIHAFADQPARMRPPSRLLAAKVQLIAAF